METMGFKLRLALNVTIALLPGIFTLLILNFLNRGGTFALLSGFFCTIISYIRPLLSRRPLHSYWFKRLRFFPETGDDIDAHEPSGLKVVIFTYGGIVFYGLLAAVAGSGLIILPRQSLLFAVLSGILGYLLFISFLAVGLYLLALFLLRTRRPD